MKAAQLSLQLPTPRLPSRYEDLDADFRSSLRPERSLIEISKSAFQSMAVQGGIRFLPVYGRSGSGKTSAAFEIKTHLPSVHVHKLDRDSIVNRGSFNAQIDKFLKESGGGNTVIVVDQYEEANAIKDEIPAKFVETLSLLDRDTRRRYNILFLWLTTSKDFQRHLVEACSRNERIILDREFSVTGPPAECWPEIIEETFRFHNGQKDLSDFGVLRQDIVSMSRAHDTVGQAIHDVSGRLLEYVQGPDDISEYCTIILWPVTDGEKTAKISQFAHAREGYKLDWNAWLQHINPENQNSLPLRELNRARLYFDVRVVPFPAADLRDLCGQFNDEDEIELSQTTLSSFGRTHFAVLLSGGWDPNKYTPMRPRVSKRAGSAAEWYPSVTGQPVRLGRRIKAALEQSGFDAHHEETISSTHAKLRCDVLVKPSVKGTRSVIVELKAFSPKNTSPSTIAEQIKVTLRRHAQFAGFLNQQ